MDVNVEDIAVLSTEFKLTMEKIHKIIKMHIIGKRMLIVGY